MIICDKPMYKAFKKHISRRNMPQFSTKLLNNIKTDLQQSKRFHRRWMHIPKHVLLCIALWHHKQVLLFDYSVAVHMWSNYASNHQLLSYCISIRFRICHYLTRIYYLVQITPVEEWRSCKCILCRKKVNSPVLEKLVQAQLITVLDTRPLVTIRRFRVCS